MKRLIVLVLVFALLMLSGCTSTTPDDFNNEIGATQNTEMVESTMKKEEIQGLWKGEKKDTHSSYLFFSDEGIYYMSSSSVPTRDRFTERFIVNGNYEIYDDDSGNTVCFFGNPLLNPTYKGVIDDSYSSLIMNVEKVENGESSGFSGKYELVTMIDDFKESDTEKPEVAVNTTSSTGDSNVDDITVRVVAKKVVSDNLKSPSSAKFSDLSIKNNSSGNYKVTGYVEADNSFGTKIKNKFSVDLKINYDKSFTYSNLILD